MKLLMLVPFLLLLLLAGAPAPAVTIQSPGGIMTLNVSVNGEGRPQYRLERRGTPVLDESRLGFILADAPKLERNFRIETHAVNDHAGRWEQPWGERRFVEDRHRELLVTFRETTPAARAMRVRFRLFDDGLGFRYELDGKGMPAEARIVEEQTEFAVAGAGTAWWTRGGEWNRYEYLYETTAIDAVAQAHTPISMRLADGTHIAIHEAALVDYAGMWLRRVEGTRFKAVLSKAAAGPSVVRALPFATPWRVVMVADDAPGLYHASDIILNLNEPSRIPEVAQWFTPHKYVGVWWEMHLDTASWGEGPKHGATTANTRRYIDFAAEHGFRGVLVEGWNPGWNGDWFGTGHDFDFTRPVAGFDLQGLAAYGRTKGVRLIGHHETAGNIGVYERQLGAALDLYARLGVDSVKTGYVADAGGIQAAGGRFEWHDGQVMSRHHLKVVEEAAKRRIAINPHEPIKDTGLRRTWPNWVTREGARGMEYNAWGEPKNPPDHELHLVFTRMLAGPMDYTPGILSLKGRGGAPIPSTMARQLALYVLLYSPLQMAADLPEHYAANPGPFRFIKDVPADWAQTRVLAGAIGELAVIARQDRAGRDWYLGAATNEAARDIDVPLGFLESGRRYRAQIYRDAADTDFRRDTRANHVIEERDVTSSDRLALRLAPGGGAAVRFVAR